MPRALLAAELDGQLHAVEIGESLVVDLANCMPPCLQLRQALQLVKTERGLNVGHVALEAGPYHLVEPGAALPVALPCVAAHPMKTPKARFVHEVLSACQHAPLGRCQVLGRVEAECDGS